MHDIVRVVPGVITGHDLRREAQGCLGIVLGDQTEVWPRFEQGQQTATVVLVVQPFINSRVGGRGASIVWGEVYVDQSCADAGPSWLGRVSA